METSKATFGAGCFWGVEEAFRVLEGVVSTSVGYSGGTVPEPTYQQVCRGDTGHAEVVEVVFDPGKVSFAALVTKFFAIHNPTTRNRQGPDVGTQYRSVIFFHDDEQQQVAEAAKAEVESTGKYPSGVVTEIVPAGAYYRAEEYHQNYLSKHGRGSCHI